MATGGFVSCIFRPLTYSEFSKVMDLSRISNVSDEIIKSALIFPAHDVLEGASTGAYEAFATSIIDCSGFLNKEAFEGMVGPSRMSAMEIYSQMGLFVCKAFPGYTPVDFDNMTHPEQMNMVAKAEMLLGTEFPWKEFFRPKKAAQPISDVPKGDFSQLGLPAYTAQQVETMSKGAVKAALLDRLARENTPEKKAERRQEKAISREKQKLLQEWGE